MAFTGKLGASNSTLGNIMLGVSSFTPTEPAELFPNLNLLTRDPETPPRMRRFVDLVSDVHNALVRSGQLVQTGASEWTLVITGSSTVTPGTYSFGPFVIDEFGRITSANDGVLCGIGPPDPTNGAAGWIYFDITDPLDPLFYYRT